MPTTAKSKSCAGYTAAATHTTSGSKTSLDFAVTMPNSGSVTLSGVVQVSYTSNHNLAPVTISVNQPPPPAPIDCVGSWGAWSACSMPCGGGTKTRTYSVTTAAAHGGQPCSAADGTSQFDRCTVEQCRACSSTSATCIDLGTPIVDSNAYATTLSVCHGPGSSISLSDYDGLSNGGRFSVMVVST